MSGPAADDTSGDHSPFQSTAALLSRLRGGDSDARDELFTRYLPRLKRLAHGRAPQGGQSITDTDDLVQMTLLRALSHVDHFEPRHEGAFLAYLRQIMLNQIRDEVRRMHRSPRQQEIDRTITDPAMSPLEKAMGREMLERYDAALAHLAPDQREAIVLRLEMGFTYQEVADALGRPGSTAARMLIQRALARLAKDMHEYR